MLVWCFDDLFAIPILRGALPKNYAVYKLSSETFPRIKVGT